MAKPIRPLTLRERKKPAQLMFEGGFKNVSFQIGEILLKGGDNEQSGPGLRLADLKKTDKISIPIFVPCSVPLIKGDSNIVCSVFGRRNPHDGLYDSFLVVRNVERLSSFNTKLRTINDLRGTADSDGAEAADRLGKGDRARQHNQVNLAGVVVGTNFENGENPKFHIQLRQTSNPDNIIHLIYDAKNAGSQVERIKFGAFIYVDGEYAWRRLPLIKLDEQGKPVYNEHGQYEFKLDENGEPLRRTHSYIRIGAPKQINDDYDINFKLEDLPRWISDMAAQMNARRNNRPGADLAPALVSDADPTSASSVQTHSLANPLSETENL
jgi:hypothetical protein